LALVVALALCLLAVSLEPGAASASTQCPWMNSSQPAATRAQELLGAMSLSDKVSMVTGTGASILNGLPTSGAGASGLAESNLGVAGALPANPSLCIPPLELNDSGNGVGDEQIDTTAFPDSIALAAAWDPGLARQDGERLGAEAFAKGVNVLLGPGMDITRDPIAGRMWEYMGEDPFLAGQIAGPVIQGIQSEHVIATAKHYALNDQETNRMTDSSDASQRTMEEIDLPAFDAAVKAGVGAVMCSYNRINSVYACQNGYTLHDVLDGQFGFGGITMSDWGATHSTVASANNGLDMEMNLTPGTYYGSALERAVQSGQVSTSTLNEMVDRILYTMFRVGVFDHVPQEGLAAYTTNASTPASIAAATDVAQDGTVLLKNSGKILPFAGSGKTIALIGQAAGASGAAEYDQAYGSGHVTELGPGSPTPVSPEQAITQRAERAGDSVTYNDGTDIQQAAAAAAGANVAIVYISDAEVEGMDRPSLNATLGSCFTLSCSYSSFDQNALVSAVAAANPHTIVVIQAGGPVAMPWIGQVQGVLDNWYPGQVDGDSVAPILFGDLDPSGHLPFTFPVKLSDSPIQSTAQYPGVMKAGDTVGPHSLYSEGLLVGYRWYDAKHIAPLFPFGFGLSYTRFRYSKLRVKRTGRDTAIARFRIKNTGGVAGADVAQVYVAMPRAAGEPPRQIKGFEKVELAPGRSKTVSIRLGPTSFVHWSGSRQTWVVSAGRYTIYVGDSSALVNLPLHARLKLRASRLRKAAY
jgi:beta-glucosidase